MNLIVRTTAPFGSVIVHVLDFKDVWVEGSKAAGIIAEPELEEL
jgi:hypothetical protein